MCIRDSLREDNADLRLTPKGRSLGLVNDHRWEFFSEKQERIERDLSRLRNTWVVPKSKEAMQVNSLLEKPISREHSLADLLARPGVEIQPLLKAALSEKEPLPANSLERQAQKQIEIQVKYQGYIDRQSTEIVRRKKQENTRLPPEFDYEQIQGLSNELKEKLMEARPENIGRASRIPGMTPAAISLLLIYLKKYQAPTRKAG